MKHCSSCGEDKPLTEFYKRGGTDKHRDKPQTYCKECMKDRMRKWVAANHQRFRDYQNAYHRQLARERRLTP